MGEEVRAAERQAASQELSELFTQAEALFESANQPDSIPLFSQIITWLDQQAAGGTLSGEQRTSLINSLSYRAQASFNFGQTETAEQDLRQIISLDQAPEFDLAQVSPKFLGLVDQLLAEMVGHLDVVVTPPAQIRVDLDRVVDPPDAPLLVGGQPIGSFSESIPLLAGPHTVTVERPGYTAAREEVAIEPGSRVPLDITLDRVSAVVWVATRPPGATVSVDSNVVGTTSDTVPEVVAAGLMPGEHRIDVTLEGHSPYRRLFTVEDLRDYRSEIELRLAGGTVALEGLPAGATVTVNGEVTVPHPPRSGSGDAPPISAPYLELPVGDHQISILHGTAGGFESLVSVEDLQSIVLPVRLRPVVALLGVLGGDTLGARELQRALESALSGLDQWAMLNRTDRGAAVVEEAGVTVDVLRELAEEMQAIETVVDWAAVQAATDRETPSSLYMIGVLSDDLVAPHADLWVWPAAPGPPQADHVRFALDEDSVVSAIRQAFSARWTVERASLGALLIDSDAAAGPLVADLTTGGPAEAAGMRLGDVIVSIVNTPVGMAAEAMRQLSALAPESEVAVTISRGRSSRTLQLQLGLSPAVVPLKDPGIFYPVLAAELAASTSNPDLTTPAWVLHLNQAAVLLQGGAWQQAILTLRAIEDAPTGPGLGQAAVDYWLGVALAALGPARQDQARDAFARAAAVAAARMFHNDGPRVAPRARARLAALGATSP